MGTAAKIQNGIVTSVILAENPTQFGAVACSDEVGPGWTFDGSTFSPPATQTAPITGADVSIERDRRMFGSFVYAGKVFDCSEKSLLKMTGAVMSATIAIAEGALAGDYRWHGEETDFTWTANDDSELKLDAPGMQLFGRAAAAHVNAVHRAAKALKAMTPIPSDYTSNTYWP